MGNPLASINPFSLENIADTVFNGGKRAGDDALRAQNSAREIADKELRDALTTQQGYLNPYLQSGQTALDQLTGSGGQFNFQADPSYQFRLSEGNKALTNAAAARGLNRSGATLKALGRFGSDLASQEYGNAFNRFNTNRNALFQLAGMGQSAANNLASLTGHASDQIASNRMGYGNAAAANYINQNNQRMGLINQGIGLGTAFLGGGFGGFGKPDAGQNNVSAQVMPANSLSGNYTLGDYGGNNDYLNYRYGGK